ncbi:hypothetical protein BH23BAC3_BH23BAC3_24330 [soil metagenome]
MNNLKELDNHIVQLVEAMRESVETLVNPDNRSEFDSDSLPEKLKFFADIEKYHQGTAKPIGDITGIQPCMFPSLKKMNDAQAAFLTDEMVRLLKAYRIYPDFPAKLPDHIKYILLCGIWDEKVVFIKDGEIQLVFCGYLPDECPFPDNYCRCRENL